MTVPERTRRWLVDAVGTDDVEIVEEPLADTSHTNHRVWVGRERRPLLLRRFANEDLADDPWYEASDEVAGLRAVAESGLPVPELIAADSDGNLTDVPTLLITWLRGAAPTTPHDLDVLELVEPLPAIHSCPLVSRTYEPYFISDGLSVEDLRPPSWTSDPQLWQRAFEVAARPWPPFTPTLVHRDYHEGNTLFIERRLTGIIDWTTACSGPAAIDLAHMRMNLTWAFGPEVGDEYLATCATVGEHAAWHPHWEVLDAIDWLGDGEARPDHTPERLARFEAYVRRALADAG